MRAAPDVELVRRAQRGDSAAFEALYRARATAVFRYARSLVGQREAAEDVTAQTFLRAWEKIAGVRDADRFDAWLFRIAHNVACNERRRPPATPIEEAPEPADGRAAHDPERLALHRANGAALRDALAVLSEEQRTIVVLRNFARYSFREIAGQIGATEGSARVAHHRALRRMRDALLAAGYVPDAVSV